jgi:predicted enzyme related to lactoylglutathione lyase
MQLGNALNWFEIPVSDFARAKKFYQTLFNYEMPENMMGEVQMGFFLHDMPGGKVGGAICRSKDHVPSDKGSIIYLNAQPDLQVALDKVETAGGKILLQKTEVSPDQKLGYFAYILDTEGNKVALHSMG